MKVKCVRKDILEVVTALCHIVSKSPLPTLGGFLCCAEKNYLIFRATDLELELAMIMQAGVEKEGKVVVPTHCFTDLIRRIPDEDIMFILDEEAQFLKVFYGQSSFSLNTWSWEEYPPLPNIKKDLREKIIIPGDIWKNAIKKVLFTAAPEKVRPNLAGVYLQLKNKVLILAATDTYRLSVFTIPKSVFEQAEQVESGKSKSLFVPSQVLGKTNKLLKLGEQLQISWDNNLVSFQTPRFTLTSRLLENQFPAYEKVVPEKSKLEIKINRTLFLSSLERASLFVEPSGRPAPVILKIEDNNLYLSVCASQMGSLSEVIPIEVLTKEFKQKDKQIEIAFNSRFLLEPLKVIGSEEITLGLNSLDGPAVYREEEIGSYLYLVLPVHLA